MENTVENKSKFNALYWYQQVFRYHAVDKRSPHAHSAFVDHYSLTPTIMFEVSYLFLKPLSSITDEDLIEVGYLQGHEKLIRLMAKDDVDSFLNGDEWVLTFKSVDYLRSKGYALPYMDLSVEKLVEYEWIKLIKENDEISNN